MTLTEQQERLATHLWAVTNFCLAHKGKAMPWATDINLLFRYVADNHYHGKLNVVYRPDAIEAVAFAWPDFAERIEAKFAESKPQFEWGPTHCGDALFIADVFGTREAVSRLYEGMMQRFPNLMAVPFYTYRKGRLVKLNRVHIERFSRKAAHE